MSTPIPVVSSPFLLADSEAVVRRAECAFIDIAQGTKYDPLERLSSLADEIARVEAVLRRLKSMQPSLRRDINQRHAPILRVLPPELLSEIFTHCISQEGILSARTDSDGISPLLLGSVCSFWRAIALTTPALWATPSLYLSKVKLNTQAELLEDWIKRSGGLPLMLRLHCGLDSDKRGTNIPEGLFETILCYANRWKGIDLQLPTQYYECLTRDQTVFSSLESLIVNPSGGQGDRSHVLNWAGCTPKLTSISLWSVYLNTIHVRWDNITRIHAKSFYIDECLEVIRRAPRLEHCDFYSIIRGDDGHALPTAPVDALHLRTLFLVAEFYVNVEAILVHLNAPNLEDFKFDAAERHLDVTNLKIFTSRCNRSLKKLSIIRSSMSEADVMAILPAIPSVEDLTLNVVQAWEGGHVLGRGVIGMLQPDKAGRCMLPHLSQLEYQGPFSFRWPDIVGLLVSRSDPERGRDGDDSTHCRAILKCASIRLRESQDEIDIMDHEQLSLLRQLAADGLNLTIQAATVDVLQSHPPSPISPQSHHVTDTQTKH